MKIETEELVEETVKFFTRNKHLILDAWGEPAGKSAYAFNYQDPEGWFMQTMAKVIPHFSGKNVLDIGCNSGLNSFIAAFSARKVVGCDIVDLLIFRAIAAKLALTGEKDFSMVNFSVGDFRSFLLPEVEGLIAARILYHIGDDGVKALEKFVASRKTFTMLVHTRPGRAKGRTTVYHGLVELPDIEAFFENVGMKPVAKLGGGSQVFVLASKE